MDDIYIVGEMVYLRALKKSDLEGEYSRWLNDPEVAKYIEFSAFPPTLERLGDYYEQLSKSKNDILLAIIDKQSNRHIGNIRLGPINWINRHVNLGILIGERDYIGKGYGPDAMKAVVAHAFNRLNLNKVTMGVASSNRRAIKAYEKAGFKKEGIGREEFFINGGYEDKIYMGLLRREFKG